MSHDVFVSYHRKSSSEIVKKVVSRLENIGVQCWYAPRDAESNYAGKITKAIDSCSVFLIILNQAASKSRNVLTEMNTAFENDDLEILPFHVADADHEISDDAMYYLRIFHKVDARNDLDAGIDELCARILKLLGKEPVQTSDPGNYITLSYCGQTYQVKAEIKTFSDGRIYTGNIVNGMRHGRGKLVLANGNIYEGDFLNDKYHGKGKFVWTDGDVYEGGWIDGNKSGKGKYVWHDGGFYEGDWINDKRMGFGKQIWGKETEWAGDCYEGNFADGVRSGKGKYIWANGDVYEGDWVEGKRTGFGKFTWAKGTQWASDYYEGNFVDGVRNGKGKYVWANGDVYDGDWLDGKRTGYGVYTYANGKVQSGRFENGKYMGKK